MDRTCPVCGSAVTGAYCSTCGDPVPAEPAAVAAGTAGTPAPAATQRPARARPQARSARPARPAAWARRPATRGQRPRWQKRLLAALTGILVLGFAISAGYGLSTGRGPAAGTAATPEAGPPLQVANRALDDGTAALDKGDKTAATAAFRQAAQNYQAVLQEDPEDLYARTFLGLTQFYLGDTTAAFTTNDQALARDPNYLWALFNGAWMSETTGNVPGALQYYQRYIAAAPAERDKAGKYAEHPQLIDLQLQTAQAAVQKLQGG